jgi:hypothetical protein
MALGATGQLAYIADSRNNRIAVWDSTGSYLRSFGIAKPQAVVPWVQSTSDSPHGVYVVDSAGRIVGLNSRGGRFLTITAQDSSPLKCLLSSEDGRHLFTLKPRGNQVLKYRIKSDDSIPGGQQAAGRLQLPTSFVLYQPWPNPSRTGVHVRYGVPRTTNVSVKLYDVAGKICRTLVNQEQKPGYYQPTWDRTDNRGRSVPCGAYFARLCAPDYVATRKLVLTR